MKTIRKPGEYAPYILIRLAADCFKRTIFLYRDEFTHDIPKEIFLPFTKKKSHSETQLSYYSKEELKMGTTISSWITLTYRFRLFQNQAQRLK